jgi:hypothetical protein
MCDDVADGIGWWIFRNEEDDRKPGVLETCADLDELRRWAAMPGLTEYESTIIERRIRALEVPNV